MNNSAERKFVNLRKRLDQLGYRHPLGIESLPLVEKLFSDLIHTTESLRNAKLSAGKTEKESRNVDALLEPYRAENARVVRENNELHLELLKLKEEKDRVSRELKAHVRKLDHETSDLKFLNNQYVHKVRCLEKDSKAKAERIQQLQEKNMQAVVQTPGGKKRSIPFRRQRMQIDELIPSSSTSAYPVSQPDDPYIADLLQLADGRIHELQEDIVKVKLDLENAQECIKHLNTQVEERDKEVERMNRALHGGRPYDVISLEAQNISNEKVISHLNLQIEYLQEANRTLDQKVAGLQQKKKDASTEVANLSLKNLELCEELTHIDDLAKRLEMDKEHVLETADMELQETKKEIQRQQKIIEDLENIITQIRREQSEGDFEKDRLRDQLVELKEQNEKMEGLVNFLEEEKIRLQDKMEKMMAADKSLVLELEAIRAKHGVCGRERSPSRLDAFVKSLEEERDHYRHEAERYKRARGAGGHNSSPIRSPSRGRSPPKGRGGVAEPEVLRLVKERDELRAALLDFEKHMEDIQNNVKALSSERDHFKTLFKQAQEDLKLARDSDMTAELTKLKEEIKQADVSMQQMAAERDTLMERLKVAQTSALADRQGEERRILDLENAVKSLERERLDLRSQVCLLKENRTAVEEELKVRCAALVHNAEEVSHQRAESNALRLLQEQMEQSLSDTQHRLSVKMNELHAAREQIEKLEETIGELSQKGSKHKEEVAVLQKSISALDREKDALQDEVDLKTEKLVVVQEELSRKEQTLKDVRVTVTNMDNSLAQLQGALNSREREITSLRRQLDACQEELAGLRRDKEITIRENRRLQDDLATMTRENQAVHVEMEEALHERDELKLRVHSYISEVSRIEKLMATKEQENRDLLERFRMAHSGVEEREQRLQQAEGLNNSIRMELLSSDSERRNLRDTVSHQGREIQQHVQALQAYEAQVSSLVRGMSRLEEELHKAQEEKAALLADLASVRELCVKLDSGKELTARQLTSRSMDLERVTGELEDVRSEAELLKKQLASERLTVRNLETLLSTNRHKEFQTHLTASEKESELKVLRDRLTLADSKTAEHAREVSQLRGKVSQLQTEMDVLKRQLITERFERERAVQEMRRQGVSFSSLQSSSSLDISSGSHHTSPERSILRALNRSSDKSADKSVSFRD
ncbi:centrosomal protein of 135 kDa isoform X1 [Sander lucioperca]|uniref:Centrosomal protein 135 n=1 Tax=Sander lucioperca TaxID=283035 RepID=A0A8C9YGG2_SANLU|nr:centrosomal protein of 135 kDa isoform X1 [Sander lucioperca]XP_031167559.1 centrosomal protein of 135 kDa isoform X1 [Sander lucioperca]XP_031167560.1 centrosomal protein of 135 kDa isoform X1 [Sander lucioperca]XP_035863070.1 centrosomal protein of 135 kDa isoform X1 [Sander lucioperca]